MTPTEYLDMKFESDKPRKCWMCACALTRGTATVDHLLPKSKGGKNRASNYRLACKPCNSKRGNKALPKRKRLSLLGQEMRKPRDFGPLVEAIRRTRQETT